MPLRVTPRGVLTATAAIAVGIVVAVGATAGSYAYLNATSSVGQEGVRVTASTALITLQRGIDPPTSALLIPAAVYRMLPGDIVNQTLTVADSGMVELALYASVTDDGPWETRLALGACPASGVLSGAALGVQGRLFATEARNSGELICLQVLLPASVSASVENTAVTFTVTIDAVQIPVP